MRAAIPTVGFLFLLVGPSPVFAQDAAAFFDDNCAMCHGIGGDEASGPDLKDITRRRDRQWLVRFIDDPRRAAQHDGEAAALVKQFDDGMPPTEGASPELIEALLRYIEEKSATSVTAASTTEPLAAGREVTAADLARGRELYEGRRPLTNGAPGCIACHQLGSIGGLGGGALGPDLTGVHQKLGGARGLTSWLRNPPTPVMRAVYRKAALDEQETHALVSFLGDREAADAPPKPSNRPLLVAAGVIGSVLAFALMGTVWSGRFRAVRRPLVAQARVRSGGQR
jgi:mono/diheme cytochrome c family protein